MTKKILTSFILLFTSLIFAQNEKEITVKGKIVDAATNTPLEYATIVFKKTTDASNVTGGITDTKGNYNIKVAAGTYNISFEYIGFKKLTVTNKSITENTNLGTTSLSVDAETLDEIEIVAEKTTVDIRLDKKIYNIGKDLTTAGGTVSDALNNVPSVSVDIEGGISLRGNENVRILINGKPSALAGFGDSNVLSQLPAEAIERVEVITSPSARYDAEGTAGILNIILRQKETLGFNGSVNLNAGHPDLVGIATTLNYRTEKFNLFSNLGFRYFDAPRTSDSDTYYFDYLDEDGILQTPEYRQIIEDQDVTRLNRNYNGNIGMEYFLSDKTSLTGSFFYRYGEDADLSTNISQRYNSGLVEQTTRYERQNEEDNSYQFALNYITKFDDNGHQLTADFQYVIDKEEQFTFLDENYDFTEDANPEPFQREQIYQTEDQKEYLVQADYVLPIGEDSRFEAGYRGSFQNEITDYLLEQEDTDDGSLFVNDTITNVFDYTENVNALYTQYGTKLGKFSFLLGLRLEHTQLKGKIDSRLSDQALNEAYGFPVDTDFDKNYLGLFPTVNLIYNLANDDQNEESITLGYNRRINRPRGWFINPFPTRSSRTRVFQGNPNLNPAFSSTFDLGYLKRWDKLTLTTSVYYQHETDAFERIQESTGGTTSDGINIIRSIPVNLSTNKRTGAELGVLYNPEKWLRLNSSINFFQFNTEGEFNGEDYSAKNTSWFARFSSKVTLPAKIDWQTNAFYRGARSNAQSDTDGIFSMDLAFSKEIFKDKATLSLNVRDLLNSRKRNSVTTTATERVTSEFQWRQRQITLSMIYRFNQKKERNRGNRNNDYNGDDEFEG